ncbi:MAG: ATP-binding protein [Candidatus Thermoplasmatota archaeon]|nr:ATP-binding protein [Candidatus Thermoplasmatota archaeon]
MLESVEVSNIACFGEGFTKVDFKPLTILVGPNNAGKSTIINAVNYIKDIILRSLSGDLTILSTLEDLVYTHDSSRHLIVTVQFAFSSDQPKKKTYSVDLDLYAGYSKIVVSDGPQATTNTRGVPSLSVSYTGNALDELQQELRQKFWYIAPIRSQIARGVQLTGRIPPTQPLEPNGSNVIQYYLRQFTDQNPKYREAEKWIAKIDPSINLVKTPFNVDAVSAELSSEVSLGELRTNVNFTHMGMGIQNIATIVGALIFSPDNSTLLIEEPENHLHPAAQEILVDLINYEVLNHSKQVIFTTHSWDTVEPYISDIGEGSKRSKNHIIMEPDKFSMKAVRRFGGSSPKIEEFNLKRKYADVRDDFKRLIG